MNESEWTELAALLTRAIQGSEWHRRPFFQDALDAARLERANLVFGREYDLSHESWSDAYEPGSYKARAVNDVFACNPDESGGAK